MTSQQVVSLVSNVGDAVGSLTVASATCPGGTTLIGGGYELVFTGNRLTTGTDIARVSVLISHASAAGTAGTWQVLLGRGTGPADTGTSGVIAKAICTV